MSFTPDRIQALARELHESERSRAQVEHFSKRFPAMTVEDGYAISRAWVAMKIAAGRKSIGHKIGLTSRAMQLASHIDEPDFGTLLDDMLFAPGEIPTDRFIAPRVEVELAFVLKKPLRLGHAPTVRAEPFDGAQDRPVEALRQAQGERLAEGITIEDVLDATEYVTPAIEIIDARIEQFDRHTKVMRKVQDTISDNAANAGIVIGGKKVDPREVDLPWCGAVLRQNGNVEETGLAAGVQGHPAVGVAWLVKKLAPWGEGLAAGEIVLAGSFTRPVAAKRGDVFDADYGPLGRFEFRFV